MDAALGGIRELVDFGRLPQCADAGPRVRYASCEHRQYRGSAEIVEHGKWGRLAPVGDDAALARAIEQTLDDSVHPDVRRRAEDFSDTRIVRQYLDVLVPGALGER